MTPCRPLSTRHWAYAWEGEGARGQPEDLPDKPPPGQPAGFSNPQPRIRSFQSGLTTMVLPRWYEGLPLAALKGKNGSPFPESDGKGGFHSQNTPSETEEIMHRIVESLIVCVLVLTLAVPAFAGHHDQGPAKQAIVLAAFGTSYPEALKSILNIRTRIEKAHPGTLVRLAFTSGIIRNIWKERRDDAAWQKANPGVPEDVLFVKSPLATLADLSDAGYKDVTVQSLHVFSGEEFADLKNTLIGLRSIRTVKAKSLPFTAMRLGRPALGMPGDAHPYTEDIAAAAQALKADVDEAGKMDAALVYMGHGNDFYSTGIYAEFQREMQNRHDYPVYVACVEGYPAFDDMLALLKQSGKKNVLLKPFMIVAGDHASNDMAGDEDDAWKVLLAKEGFTVKTDLRGLGMVDAWADIYVRHLDDALAQTHLLP